MFKAVIASCVLALIPVCAYAPTNAQAAEPATNAAKPVKKPASPAAAPAVAAVSAPAASETPLVAPAAIAEIAPPALLSDSLRAYAALQQDVSSLRAHTIKTSKDVDKALVLISHHKPAEIGQGYYAYLAVIAGQDPVFAADVRKIASEFGRDKVVQTLPSSVRYIRESAKGANNALQLALRAAANDSARLLDTSERYREFSISLQKQAWAKRPIGATNKTRLIALRKAEAAPSTIVLPLDTLQRLAPEPGTIDSRADPTALGGAMFWDALGTKAEAAVLTSYAPPKIEEVSSEQILAMDRVLTLAAMYVLEGQKDNPAGVAKLLTDGTNAERCISLNRSAFYSAVSASQFQYESIASVQAHLVSYAKCLDAIRLKPAA